MIDYKFWYIKRDDDGFITEVAVKFFEGSVMPVNVLDKDDKVVSVDRYVRTKRLSKNDVPDIGGEFTQDSGGNPAKLYTPIDFGQIKTDNELRYFMNQQVAKDKSRQSIPEQRNG